MEYKLFYVGTPARSTLFSYSFHYFFTQWYILQGLNVWIKPPSSFLPSPWGPLKPLGLPIPSEKEYGTDCISPPSPLLYDVEKPIIWLETVVVELYGWIHFHRHLCITTWWLSLFTSCWFDQACKFMSDFSSFVGVYKLFWKFKSWKLKNLSFSESWTRTADIPINKPMHSSPKHSDPQL